MSVASSVALSVNALPGWNIFFAKEPTPAADPNQSDMDKTVVLGPPGKKGPTPPSMKERMLFLALVLIITGGGAYLAWNPETLMGLLGNEPGEAPPPPRPRVAKPVAPAPSQPTAMAPAAAPAAPAMAPAPAASSAVPAIPTPKFGEGEKVSVSAPTTLTADSAGKKPGTTTAAPGSTLVVLDADLQNFAWVYSIRTEQGVTGWVAETNLVAK